MTVSAGVVKWFGGYNKAKDTENRFGFVDGISGSDVFLHQSQWLGNGKPDEDQLVYFELEEKKGKWSAKNAKALNDVTSDKLIELFEIITAGPKNLASEAVSEYIETKISVELSSFSAQDAQALIDQVGLQKLLGLLLWKSDWRKNVDFMESTKLIKPLMDIKWSWLPSSYITEHAEQMAGYLLSLDQSEARRLAQEAFEILPPELKMFCLLAGYIQDIDTNEDDNFSGSTQVSKDTLDSCVRKVYSQKDKVPEYLKQLIKIRAASSGSIFKDPTIGPYFSYYQFKKYLYDNNLKFIALYDASEYLQSRFDCFVLKEIFSLILAGNPLDTVYSLFMGRLWAAISSGNIDPIRQAKEILALFPECGTVRPSLSCEAVYWKKQEIFLCRGYECTNPKIIGRPEQKDYSEFTIYDWFSHFGVNYLADQEPTSRDFPIKLAGYLNRLREIFKALHCRHCASLLLPDMKYARIEYTDIENGKPVRKDMAPAYRLTVFKCPNTSCVEHQKGHYINHCMGFDCYHLIDSRDSNSQCSTGRYICRGCGSCCSDHAKTNPIGLCPDCGSPLKLFESREYDARKKKNKRYVECENQRCIFSIRPEELSRRFYLDSCRPETTTTQAY